MTFWSVAHFLRRAVGDLAAVVEHHHPVADVHHHAHVVLDQHDGGAELVVDVEHEAAHVLLFLQVHAGHRLVQQQELRLGGERARELDALLQAVGQAPDRRLADVLDLEEVDDFLAARRCSSSSRFAGPNQTACCRKLQRIFRLRPVITLSSTVMPLNSAMFWKVRAMPSAAAWCGSMSEKVFSLNLMFPLCGW
jgi:hypothetical protein